MIEKVGMELQRNWIIVLQRCSRGSEGSAHAQYISRHRLSIIQPLHSGRNMETLHVSMCGLEMDAHTHTKVAESRWKREAGVTETSFGHCCTPITHKLALIILAPFSFCFSCRVKTWRPAGGAKVSLCLQKQCWQRAVDVQFGKNQLVG